MSLSTVQTVHCPNCGSLAQKCFYENKDTNCPNNQSIHVECPVCDYYVLMCSFNANILEAYAPGTSVKSLSQKSNFGLKKSDEYLKLSKILTIR